MKDINEGDTVDVTIKRAKVIDVFANCVVVQYGSLAASLPYDNVDITVSRVTVSPQPGNVWRLANGDEAHIFSEPDGNGGHRMVARFPLGSMRLIEEINWCGAVRKHPPPATTPAALDADDHALILAILGERVGGIPSGSVDTDEARALYRRLTQDEAPPPATESMLRRFEDPSAEMMTETSPGCGLFHSEYAWKGLHAEGREGWPCLDPSCALTLEDLHRKGAREVDPVPAGDTEAGR